MNKLCNDEKKLYNIRYLVIDVDGTLTDSGIYYDEHGNEMKKFSTKDAAGFFIAKACGIKILILTGRKCGATERRMKELKVDYLEQGILDKTRYLKEFMEKNNIKKEEIAYIGDDLNDLSPMSLTGWIACPKNSAEEIIDLSDYVSEKKGGEGAVSDIIRHILKNTGKWDEAVKKCYNTGI